jgi:hypothetical protein
VHSDIVTQSGLAERRRTVIRTAQYDVAAHSDTLVITADTVSLAQDADGTMQPVDVDALIGARWTLTLGPGGAAVALDSPVVPRAVADVSDIGRAMEDFFPQAPPVLVTGAEAGDGGGGKWRRLADSSGVARYHFSGTRHANNRTRGDSVAVDSDESITETANVAWDRTRGPLAWTRHIVIIETSHFAGRTVRAQVDQQIAVRRIQSP